MELKSLKCVLLTNVVVCGAPWRLWNVPQSVDRQGRGGGRWRWLPWHSWRRPPADSPSRTSGQWDFRLASAQLHLVEPFGKHEVSLVCVGLFVSQLELLSHLFVLEFQVPPLESLPFCLFCLSHLLLFGRGQVHRPNLVIPRTVAAVVSCYLLCLKALCQSLPTNIIFVESEIMSNMNVSYLVFMDSPSFPETADPSSRCSSRRLGLDVRRPSSRSRQGHCHPGLISTPVKSLKFQKVRKVKFSVTTQVPFQTNSVFCSYNYLLANKT